MKCMSCECEINPKWKHAIDNNICPFCGQSIMEEDLKKCFTNLNVIMLELKEYSGQLEDWLLSNYGFIKTDSPNLINYVSKDLLKSSEKSKKGADEVDGANFTVKVKTERGEEDVLAKKIQSEDRTNEFFKRAEVFKPNIDGFNSAAEKTQRLKSMASEIKKAGTSAMSSGGYVTAEMMENADEIASMQSLISDGNVVESSLSTIGDDDIPSVVLNMAKVSGNKNSSANASDLLKLQQMQDRVLNSRRSFESGENRGGKGGGFSRVG